MQDANIGYLAVSLLSYNTLFNASAVVYSSESILRIQMRLTDGLVRISIGLDDDIDRTYIKMSTFKKKIILKHKSSQLKSLNYYP